MEIRDSFTPLQLDVFHAHWETYKRLGCRPRSSKGGRDSELRAKVLHDFPASTQVGRPFAGADGVSRIVVGRVYDFRYRTGGCGTRTGTGRSLVAVK